jgi:alpha-tubulin suppressor-like RCC1 family protein
MKNTSMPKKFLEKQSFGVPFHFLWAGCLLSLLTTVGIVHAATVDKIAAGGSHSLILKTDGSLWAVGSNSNGQLGDGTQTDRNVPVKIESSGVTSIAAGENHSLYIKSDGSSKNLWGMGSNGNGQLGVGNASDQNVSILIESVSLSAGDLFQVSADGNHTLYLKSDLSIVQLRGMGASANGQLGNFDQNVTTPIIVNSDMGTDANKSNIKISTGDNHSMYLEDNGSLWLLGKNDQGQLGDGTDTNKSTAVMIEPSGVTDISAGGNHSLYIKGGKLWAMGSNADGQLGDSTNWDRNRPILVPGIVGNIASIHAGKTYSYFRKQDGSVWRMGNNSYGQLGNGTNSAVSYPSELNGFSGANISAGGSHILLLKSDSSLWATGNNSNGQLGDGTTTSSISAVTVKAYYLTLSVSGTGGTISSSQNYAYNESVSISGIPDIGFVFGGWSGDQISSDSPYTFNIQEDLAISASFSQDTSDDDGDGLSNYEELITLGTDPNDNDTDDDGFNDYDEDMTDGLDPKTANTGLRTFFLASETAAYGNGFADGNDSGQSYVVTNFSSFSLFDQNDINSATSAGETAGINMVTASPSTYSLFDQSDIDAATAAGQTTGINSVTSSPATYNLFVQSDLDTKFDEGNASGIAYVQANPSQFNFLTDAERNASYDQGYAEGNASGILWVQNNLSAYDLATADELAAAVDAAKAEALAEVQADLATEGLSSLTYLDQVTGQSIPNTDGWYFQPGLGWLWTNRDTFPFIYRQATDSSSARWLYFSQLPEQTDKPLYDYESKTWISFSGN